MTAAADTGGGDLGHHQMTESMDTNIGTLTDIDRQRLRNATAAARRRLGLDRPERGPVHISVALAEYMRMQGITSTTAPHSSDGFAFVPDSIYENRDLHSCGNSTRGRRASGALNDVIYVGHNMHIRQDLRLVRSILKQQAL